MVTPLVIFAIPQFSNLASCFRRKQRADEGGDLLAEHHMSTRSKNKDKPRVEKSISIKVGTFGAKKSPTIDVKSA